MSPRTAKGKSLPASVLVVDDSPLQRKLTTSLCAAAGIAEVLQAGDGRQALALIEERAQLPGLLIVDLEMPVMDGAALLVELQRRQIDMPIFVLSSRERSLLDSIQEMGLVLGLRVEAVMQKPLRAESLREALQGLGGRQRRRRRPARVAVGAEDLRLAMSRGEIGVHFQPKADLRSGVVRGVEALARWTHPRLGAVAPEQFVPLAERSGLIHALTTQVLGQGLRQAGRWQSMGLHLSLAVNVSPLLLDHPGLADEFDAMAREHQVPAERIVLEVTESALVSQLGVALGTLAQLRLRGFGLSIDDYGTGFSSMRQLARAPFTELKIDRSFVAGAPARDSLQVMLRSSIEMANQLGLVSVAEGVESVEEWRLLQDCGCSVAQGWLIAQAMPGEALPQWMHSERQRLAALGLRTTRARGRGRARI